MIDRTNFRTSEEKQADNMIKAILLARHFDWQDMEQVSKAIKCPLSTLKRAIAHRTPLKMFLYSWFYEKPYHRVPRDLLESINADALSDFRAEKRKLRVDQKRDA